MNVHDITSEYCRLRKNIHVERLDQFNSADGEWMEQVVEDKRSGPAETAAMRIDFTEWLSQLPKRIRQIAKRLAVGESTGEVANCFQVSSARVSQLRRELHTAWNTFQSEYSRDPAETNA
jgi:DNA-directed RNA polymerase specialized sigma subunit